jgi:hypothetical protein
MSTVFLTVADLFARVFLKHSDVTVRWFKNATRQIMPQGGLVGFISLQNFATHPHWGPVSTSAHDVVWTESGGRVYCVGVLCADGDLGGASAQPVAVFSYPIGARCGNVFLSRVDNEGTAEDKTCQAQAPTRVL